MHSEIDAFICFDFVRRMLTKFSCSVPLSPNLTQDIVSALINPEIDLSDICHFKHQFDSIRSTSLYEAFQKVISEYSLPKEWRDKFQCAFRTLSEPDPDVYMTDPSAEPAVPCPGDSLDCENGVSVGVTLPSEERKKGLFVSPLKRLMNSTGDKPVKKEYFRSQCIRATKKTLRLLSKDQQASTGIHKATTTEQKATWQLIEALYKQCPNNYNRMSSVFKEKNNINDAQSIKFFCNDAVRRIHYRCCELAYQRPPADLCTLMKAKCCSSGEHNSDCVRLWGEIELYAKFGMLEELGYNRTALEAEYRNLAS